MEPKRERNRKENDDVLYIFANERRGRRRAERERERKKRKAYLFLSVTIPWISLISPPPCGRIHTRTHTHAYDMLKHRGTCFLSPSTCMPRRERCCCILIIRTEWYANERTNEPASERERETKRTISISDFSSSLSDATIDINEQRDTVVSLSGLAKWHWDIRQENMILSMTTESSVHWSRSLRIDRE